MKNKSNLKILAAGLAVLILLSGAAVWWGYGHLTQLVQRQLQGFAGDDLTIGRVLVRWNRVELEQVRLARRGGGPFERRLSIDRLVLRPRLASLLSGRLELGAITIDKPYLLLEVAPDGSLVKPFPARPAPSRATGGSSLPVTVSALRINNGTIDILDWHVALRGGLGLSNPRQRYHLQQLNGIDLELGGIDLPLADRSTRLQLAMKSQGGGHLALNGSFSPKSLNGTLKLVVSDLNIIGYRPYFLKKGDLDVAAGQLSLRSEISVEKRQLKAPGEVQLKGLAFDNSGVKGFWMGIPAWALVSSMADSKGTLRVNFDLNGSLDNPHFKVRQSFVEQLAAGLSSKIGVAGPASIGKGLIDAGSSGVKGLFKVFGR